MPICLGLGLTETGWLGLPEPLLDVAAEGIDGQEPAGGAIRLVIAVHPAPPLRLAQRDPVGGRVTGTSKAQGMHQRCRAAARGALLRICLVFFGIVQKARMVATPLCWLP